MRWVLHLSWRFLCNLLLCLRIRYRVTRKGVGELSLSRLLSRLAVRLRLSFVMGLLIIIIAFMWLRAVRLLRYLVGRGWWYPFLVVI